MDLLKALCHRVRAARCSLTLQWSWVLPYPVIALVLHVYRKRTLREVDTLPRADKASNPILTIHSYPPVQLAHAKVGPPLVRKVGRARVRDYSATLSSFSATEQTA